VTPRASSLALVFGLCVSCRAEAPAAEPARRPAEPALVFAFGVPDGTIFGSESTRGRVTAVLFITTFDLPSQLMARRLSDVTRSHRPRVNVGAVALEPPRNAVLVDAFKSSLSLTYPVSLADPATLAGSGPFGRVRGVPALVVLDREGRPRYRTQGVISVEEIERALRSAARP
jgi:hypothetical protein